MRCEQSHELCANLPAFRLLPFISHIPHVGLFEPWGIPPPLRHTVCLCHSASAH